MLLNLMQSYFILWPLEELPLPCQSERKENDLMIPSRVGTKKALYRRGLYSERKGNMSTDKVPIFVLAFHLVLGSVTIDSGMLQVKRGN